MQYHGGAKNQKVTLGPAILVGVPLFKSPSFLNREKAVILNGVKNLDRFIGPEGEILRRSLS
jgi:hypothetical protein